MNEEQQASRRRTRRESPATVARVLDPAERATKREATAKRRSDGKAARKADRVKRGGKAEQEHLYAGRSPGQAARARAAEKAETDRKMQAARTNGRGEGLYSGKSEATKARDTAAKKAAADKASQAGRRADGGLHSSAAAQDRKSTKAKEVAREGLYDNNSPANRARGRAAGKASEDAQNQARRQVGSPEYKAEKERKRREAEEQKRLAEEKAQGLEARARAARERAERLKGKERRAARDEAEKLEGEARKARDEAQAAAREARQASGPEQDHLYDGQSSADKAREKADRRRSEKQHHLYGLDPVAAIRAAAARSVSLRQDHLYTSRVTEAAPVSSPPAVTSPTQAMQTACTAQAWAELDAELALLS